MIRDVTVIDFVKMTTVTAGQLLIHQVHPIGEATTIVNWGGLNESFSIME